MTAGSDAVRILQTIFPRSRVKRHCHLLWRGGLAYVGASPGPRSRARVPMLAMTELAGNFSETILPGHCRGVSGEYRKKNFTRWQMLNVSHQPPAHDPQRHRLYSAFSRNVRKVRCSKR